MKTLLTMLMTLIISLTINVSAQTTNHPTFIKGNIDIKYNTKNSPGVAGVKDLYTININVNNTIGFHGNITDTPQIISGIISKSVTQPRSVNYSVNCDLINPNNPSQVKKNISQLLGTVPIASSGEYNYGNGSLGFSVLDRIAGSDSKFTGVAEGKPLVRPSNWLDTLQRQAVNITRSVNGKTVTVVLKKYDKMDFRQVVLGAGPLPLYQDVTLNGEMLYDYDKNTWFFNNVTAQYAITTTNGENVVKIDRIAGTIRWVEDENRKTNGKGEYQFDIRINEPLPNENSSFSPPASGDDESAFFTTDNSVPGLTGTMKYQDTLRGDDTLASAVSIDLTGNNITKQQNMVLCKMVIFASVIPMNSD